MNLHSPLPSPEHRLSEDGLVGRAAVITGAATPVGRAVARALAVRGTDILLQGVGEHRDPNATVAMLRRLGAGRVSTLACDLCGAQGPEALIKRATWELGRVDLLVNVTPASESSLGIQAPEDFIAQGTSAAARTIAAVLPHMVLRGWGRLLTVAQCCDPDAGDPVKLFVVERMQSSKLKSVGADIRFSSVSILATRRRATLTSAEHVKRKDVIRLADVAETAIRLCAADPFVGELRREPGAGTGED